MYATLPLGYSLRLSVTFVAMLLLLKKFVEVALLEVNEVSVSISLKIKKVTIV